MVDRWTVASPTAPIDLATAPAWRLIITGATLRFVWRIPLLVGTLLTLVNQGARMAGGLEPMIMVPVVFNYLTPYVVSSLGFLAAQRVGANGSRQTETTR